MNTDISVLMSLYFKEKPEYLRTALDSILEQTVLPKEIVMVKDGPLTEELEAVLSEYSERYPEMFVFVPLEKNVGLGLALAEGMLHCSCDLVARMDTDDFSRKDRFERQLAEFQKDPELDICGSHMNEFESTPDEIVAKRTVPLCDADIKEYQKRRDGFNHVTVMFKRESVLAAGNYKSCLLMEDTLLWVNLFKHGAKAMNIDDYLVYARIGKDMYERRGGYAYFKKYKNARKIIYETGYISRFDYYYTILVQFVVALMPNKLRGFLFKKILHK